MNTQTRINFTNGPIVWPLILFAVPLVLAELLQNLYSSVDSIAVGNFVGESALAAISVCSTLSHLFVSFFVGLSVGGSVVTARVFGSADQVLLCRTMRGVFSFSVILGVILSVSGILLAPFLLRIAGVAVATVIAQALSVLWLWNVLRRAGRSLGGTFCVNFKELAGDRKFILELLRIGTPAGLQGALVSFSNLFV